MYITNKKLRISPSGTKKQDTIPGKSPMSQKIILKQEIPQALNVCISMRVWLQLMWLKQCHKLPIWEGLYHLAMVILGMVDHCFNMF